MVAGSCIGLLKRIVETKNRLIVLNLVLMETHTRAITELLSPEKEKIEDCYEMLLKKNPPNLEKRSGYRSAKRGQVTVMEKRKVSVGGGSLGPLLSASRTRQTSHTDNDISVNDNANTNTNSNSTASGRKVDLLDNQIHCDHHNSDLDYNESDDDSDSHDCCEVFSNWDEHNANVGVVSDSFALGTPKSMERYLRYFSKGVMNDHFLDIAEDFGHRAFKTRQQGQDRLFGEPDMLAEMLPEKLLFLYSLLAGLKWRLLRTICQNKRALPSADLSESLAEAVGLVDNSNNTSDIAFTTSASSTTLLPDSVLSRIFGEEEEKKKKEREEDSAVNRNQVQQEPPIFCQFFPLLDRDSGMFDYSDHFGRGSLHSRGFRNWQGMANLANANWDPYLAVGLNDFFLKLDSHTGEVQELKDVMEANEVLEESEISGSDQKDRQRQPWGVSSAAANPQEAVQATVSAAGVMHSTKTAGSVMGFALPRQIDGFDITSAFKQDFLHREVMRVKRTLNVVAPNSTTSASNSQTATGDNTFNANDTAAAGGEFNNTSSQKKKLGYINTASASELLSSCLLDLEVGDAPSASRYPGDNLSDSTSGEAEPDDESESSFDVLRVRSVAKGLKILSSVLEEASSVPVSTAPSTPSIELSDARFARLTLQRLFLLEEWEEEEERAKSNTFVSKAEDDHDVTVGVGKNATVEVSQAQEDLTTAEDGVTAEDVQEDGASVLLDDIDLPEPSQCPLDPLENDSSGKADSDCVCRAPTWVLLRELQLTVERLLRKDLGGGKKFKLWERRKNYGSSSSDSNADQRNTAQFIHLEVEAELLSILASSASPTFPASTSLHRYVNDQVGASRHSKYSGRNSTTQGVVELGGRGREAGGRNRSNSYYPERRMSNRTLNRTHVVDTFPIRSSIHRKRAATDPQPEDSDTNANGLNVTTDSAARLTKSLPLVGELVLASAEFLKGIVKLVDRMLRNPPSSSSRKNNNSGLSLLREVLNDVTIGGCLRDETPVPTGFALVRDAEILPGKLPPQIA